MKILALAGLLAAANPAPPPYTFLLHFPDGSLEICPANSFSIGFPTVDVQVQSCVSDKVFANGFEG